MIVGIGKFCIVDDKLVTESDAGKNFFLNQECVGKGLAESCTGLLSELNKDVAASFLMKVSSLLNKSPSDLIRHHQTLLRDFSVIIVSDHIDQEDLIRLSVFCRSKSIPLVLVRSYGFFGYCRIDFQEHTGSMLLKLVVESHIESDTAHLQLGSPPSGLFELASKYSLESNDSTMLSHIPYPLILILAVELWKSRVGEFPPPKDKRRDFSNFVKSFGSNLVDDENFQEAIKFQNLNPMFEGVSV